MGGGLQLNDTYTVTAEYLQNWSAVKYIYEGAELELRSDNFAPKGWKGKVVSYKWNYNVYDSANAHGCTITFDRPLPANISSSDYLFNTDMFCGEYLIEKNTMYGGLCHAMYIGLPNGTIRNNTAECFGYPALALICVKRWGRWYIGGPVKNVLVADNHFKNINLNKRDPASLFIGAGNDLQPTGYYPTSYFAVQDVVVENNVVENSGLIAIGVGAARNILFHNNTIINPNLYENRPRFDGFGRMYAINSDNIHFNGNTVEITEEVYGEDGVYTAESNDVYVNGIRQDS